METPVAREGPPGFLRIDPPLLPIGIPAHADGRVVVRRVRRAVRLRDFSRFRPVSR